MKTCNINYEYVNNYSSALPLCNIGLSTIYKFIISWFLLIYSNKCNNYEI